MAEISSAFDEVYKQVQAIYGQGKITSAQLLVLTPRVIQLVQKIGLTFKMSGQEKKQLFFDIVQRLIDTSQSTDEEKQELKVFVNAYLPLIVDGLVYAYKSDAFDKIKSEAKKCFASCRP